MMMGRLSRGGGGGGGPVANSVTHGLVQVDRENVSNQLLKVARNALEEISNMITSRRAQAGKKLENPRLEVEGAPRVTNPISEHLLPSCRLKEAGLFNLDLIPTSVDLAAGADLCQAFSEMLHSNIGDLDAEDQADPQLCSDYVTDIYRYLRQLEVQQCVSPRYLEGSELNGRMRAILVDWLVEVHARFQLLQETLYMSVAIMDRYLQAQPVSRKELQLVGITAMLLAAKYEEIYAPSILDFVYMTDRAYKAGQIRTMEQNILKELNFNLGRPLPVHFLRRAAKVADTSAKSYLLAKYLMELTLVDYEMVHYHPSEVAAAALCLSQKVLSEGQWDTQLCYHTGYWEETLSPIMKHMTKNIVRVNKNLTQQVAVKKKYASRKHLRISALPQLNSSTVMDLATPLLAESRQPM